MKKLITVVVLLILTLLCCSGCAQNIEFYSAEIYHSSIAVDERVDSYVYVKSVDELKSYYDASKDGLESMKEDVFEHYKYDEDYFRNKCILFIFHRHTSGIINEDINSISLSNNILTVKATHTGLDDSLDSIVVVIELDKKYAGTEVKFIMENR